MSTPAEQFFMAPPIFKFDKVGDEVSGFIAYQEVRQETEYNTQKPKYWDDGRPKLQLIVTLRTNLREGPDDDGLRRWFIKGKSMTGAVRDALRSVSARGFEIDGWARCAYVGDGQATPGAQAPKLYLAEYRRPQAAPQAPQPQQGFQQVPQGFQQAPQQQFYQPAAAPQQGFAPAGTVNNSFPPRQPQAQPPF